MLDTAVPPLYRSLQMKQALTALVLLLYFGSDEQVTAAIVMDVGGLGAADLIIDFEDTSAGRMPEILGVSFIREGVVSQPPTLGLFSGSTSAGAASRNLFGSRFWGNSVNGSPSQATHIVQFSNLGIEFSQPRLAVGAWFANISNFLDIHASEVLFRTLDAEGTLVTEFEIVMPGVGNPAVFAGATSERGISRVEFLVPGPEGFLGVDNVFVGEVVPEPSIGVSLLMGILALARRRTRRPESEQDVTPNA
jgi:hypothetical protein